MYKLIEKRMLKKHLTAVVIVLLLSMQSILNAQGKLEFGLGTGVNTGQWLCRTEQEIPFEIFKPDEYLSPSVFIHSHYKASQKFGISLSPGFSFYSLSINNQIKNEGVFLNIPLHFHYHFSPKFSALAGVEISPILGNVLTVGNVEKTSTELLDASALYGINVGVEYKLLSILRIQLMYYRNTNYMQSIGVTSASGDSLGKAGYFNQGLKFNLLFTRR